MFPELGTTTKAVVIKKTIKNPLMITWTLLNPLTKVLNVLNIT